MSKLLLLLSCVGLLSFYTNDWFEFVSEKGKFTVLSPGEMANRTNSLETEIGQLDYHTFLYQPKSKEADNLVYMVSYVDYPNHSIHSDSTELLKDFFDATIETAVQSVEGELMYSADAKLKDYPGKIWRVHYNDEKAQIKTKAFLVDNRYYSIQTITLKEKSLNPSSDKFLDSFRLLE